MVYCVPRCQLGWTEGRVTASPSLNRNEWAGGPHYTHTSGVGSRDGGGGGWCGHSLPADPSAVCQCATCACSLVYPGRLSCAGARGIVEVVVTEGALRLVDAAVHGAVADRMPHESQQAIVATAAGDPLLA